GTTRLQTEFSPCCRTDVTPLPASCPFQHDCGSGSPTAVRGAGPVGFAASRRTRTHGVVSRDMRNRYDNAVMTSRKDPFCRSYRPTGKGWLVDARAWPLLVPVNLRQVNDPCSWPFQGTTRRFVGGGRPPSEAVKLVNP